jgi:hypothetical protein
MDFIYCAQPEDPCLWLIDLGPFFDRFGPAVSMEVEMSTNATVQAVLRNFSRRKWIDLRDPRVASGIDLIASVITNVIPLKTFILTTPVAPVDNLALRKAYFS